MSSVLAENISNHNSESFQKFIDKISEKKYILLGENTHGTKEFYEMRSLITLEICKKKDNVIILFESDWIPLLKLDAYINSKLHNSVEQSVDLITEYPLWMIRNKSILKLLKNLKYLIKNNEKTNEKNNEKNINFFGIDCYDIKRSALHIKQFLQKHKIPLDKLENFFTNIEKYKDFYNKKIPFNEFKYLSNLINTILHSRKFNTSINEYEKLSILQSLNVIINGYNYYLTVQNEKQGHKSWNIRDNHWLNTIETIYKTLSMKNKTFIIWAHNSHVNDTVNSSINSSNKINIGSLVRRKFGKKNSALIGFYTSTGTVTATNEWNEPPILYKLKDAKYNSYENYFNILAKNLQTNKLLITISLNKNKGNIILPKIAETREIGVNYKKNHENIAHYSNTILSKKYDYVIYIKHTSGVEPLDNYVNWHRKHIHLKTIK